jgi:hypothetical protein
MTMRSFRDAEGRTWRVWQVIPQSEILRTTSPELAGGWLCFENNGDKRRLVGTPEGWHEHTDAELERLLRRASPVRRPGDS